MEKLGADTARQDEDGKAAISLAALFLRFLRFGSLAWGGPVAQIAMLRDDVVERERWISPSRFSRLLAVYQVLPGPEAHELCVHLGMLRRGRLGGLLAGLGFMLPGFVLMLGLSWLYFRIDLSQPAIGALLLGAQVGVMALIVRAVDRIRRHVLVDLPLVGLAVATGLASLAGVQFWVSLPVAGLLYVLGARLDRAPLVAGAAVVVASLLLLAAWAGAPADIPVVTPLPPATMLDPSPVALFASGLKAGLLTFGGAYTVIPFLRDDAVGSGWLSDSQFLDGLALSGILPAPLIIFSTFVGYVAGGFVGAMAMTVGIFLPAFGFGLLFGNRLEAGVQHEGLRRLLEGVAAGVVGLIAVTAIELALTLSTRVPSLLIASVMFLAALAVLFAWKSKANVILAVAATAAAGWLAFGG